MALGTFLALQFGKERKQKSFFPIFKIITQNFRKDGHVNNNILSNREEIFWLEKIVLAGKGIEVNRMILITMQTVFN